MIVTLKGVDNQYGKPLVIGERLIGSKPGVGQSVLIIGVLIFFIFSFSYEKFSLGTHC